MSYDKNGNITNLQRKGSLGGSTYDFIDNLTYHYGTSGNQLQGVTDNVNGNLDVGDFRDNGSSNDYTYWADGSLKSDANKGITNIIYDTFLKRAIEIQLTGETGMPARWIKMYYDGGGHLYKRVFSTGETWEYVGKMVFKNGVPFSLSTPEGRALYENNAWIYEFFYQDHLGNTRVAFRANGNQLEKTSETAFDPTGIELAGVGQSSLFENRNKHQNKESLTLFGLSNIEDFGARYLDKSIMRWWGVDEMAEKYSSFSPYNYVLNNPILYTDPDGRDVKDDYKLLKNGEVVLSKKTTDNFDKLTASNGNSIKIEKENASDGTIISQLSAKDKDGFSIGKTNNATVARNLYNFMNDNTTRGIEFSLSGEQKNTNVQYKIGTSHKLTSTNIDKLKLNPESLIFLIHNHDGDLTNGNTTSASPEDKIVTNNILMKLSGKTVMVPRFYISNENGNLREYFHGGGPITRNSGLNMSTVNLKQIKTHDFFKIK